MLLRLTTDSSTGDGIKSAVRRHYLPAYELEVGRAFTMRGVFPTSRLDGMADFPEDSACVVVLGRSWGLHLKLTRSRLLQTLVGSRPRVLYVSARFVARRPRRQGRCPTDGPRFPAAKGIFSFVAFIPDELLKAESEDQSYATAKWDESGSTKDLVGFYRDWHPIIRRVCESADDVRMYPGASSRPRYSNLPHPDRPSPSLADFHGPPLERMDLPTGRAALLGDAGHPHGQSLRTYMLLARATDPALRPLHAGGAFAVGGSLAIEDAYALSLCIRRSLAAPTALPLAAALSLYSTLRVAHVNKVIAAALSVRRAKDRRNDLGLKMSEDEIRRSVLERVETEWIAENDVGRDFDRLAGALPGPAP